MELISIQNFFSWMSLKKRPYEILNVHSDPGGASSRRGSRSPENSVFCNYIERYVNFEKMFKTILIPCSYRPGWCIYV